MAHRTCLKKVTAAAVIHTAPSALLPTSQSNLDLWAHQATGQTTTAALVGCFLILGQTKPDSEKEEKSQ